jgi:transcription elongation factor Elf1
MNERDALSKMKPCPFCGSEKLIIIAMKTRRLQVNCTNPWCGSSSGYCDKLEELVKVWNTRVGVK